MKTITFTLVAIIATTTLAHAGLNENRCWNKVTQQLERAGCQFGNEFTPNARRCLERQQSAYKSCLLQAYTTQRILRNVTPAHGVPTIRSTNLRFK